MVIEKLKTENIFLKFQNRKRMIESRLPLCELHDEFSGMDLSIKKLHKMSSKNLDSVEKIAIFV